MFDSPYQRRHRYKILASSLVVFWLLSGFAYWLSGAPLERCWAMSMAFILVLVLSMVITMFVLFELRVKDNYHE